MISLFQKATKTPPRDLLFSEIDSTPRRVKKSTPSLLPGSRGEHALQEKYGTRQRALKFYDRQMLDHLSPIMREFIPRQEVAFIATSDKHGECDCSARFGEPGFFRVINERFLIYPEYRGNGVMASQGNLAENPHIGIIFVDFFETSVGLHVNGKARVIDNAELLEFHGQVPESIIDEINIEGKKRPERWILISVEEAYIHCSKHIPLLKKLDKRIDWGTDDVAAKGGDFFQIKDLSLYEKLGGENAVNKIAERLYLKISADPEIAGIFKIIDTATQIRSHRAFLSRAFGDKKLILDVADLEHTHKELLNNGLNSQHADRLLAHLKLSLSELAVPNHEIESIISALQTQRGNMLYC